MLTLNDGRSELWQWDTGRKLTVDAECSQVHFSNKVFGRSVDVDVENREAAIPDVLLQSEKDIYAWAFVGTPENGYTKISRIFKVNRRNKPADYVFTPEEQMTIQEIKDIAQSVRDDADSGKFDGKDGVSATHEWDGTTLVVTSASGTSSADLKGGKGDKGDKGDRGKPGEPGVTPVKGEDYWTDADKQEIVDEVLSEVPQDDWEQSNPAAPDYIKNRPFRSGEIVVLEEQTVTTEYSEDEGNYSDDLPNVVLEAGKKYFVAFNGIVYECVAESMSEEEGHGENVALGNGELLDWFFPGHGIANMDAPFAISYEPDYRTLLVTEEEGTYTIKVTSTGGVVVDPAYQEAIKALLPTVELVATMDDGTKQTLKLYGEAVTG